MELFQEILAKALESEKVEVTFPGLTLSPAELVEMRSYDALCQIKRVLEDDTLSDCECFRKIEAIVGVLESLGSHGGTRHDFG